MQKIILSVFILPIFLFVGCASTNMFFSVEKEINIAKNSGLDKNKCTKDIYSEIEKEYLNTKRIWNNTTVCFETIDDNKDDCTRLFDLYRIIEGKLNKIHTKLIYLNHIKNNCNL